MFEKKSLVDNMADEEQVRNAEEKEERRKKSIEDDIKDVINTPQGRRVFWHYISFCGVFRAMYQEHGLMSFAAGQRNIGLKMLDDLAKSDPKAFVQMWAEQATKKEN